VSNVVCGKKSRKNKRPKDQEDYTTIQPNVVAYSTFGVNDVVSYDGFIPTSPDYATFLSGVNQESTTRLYAPAFPSSMDTTGFGGNYGAQAFEGQSFGVNEVNMGQPGGMLQYSSNSMNFFNNPNFGTTAEQNNNNDSEGASGHNHNAEETDSPVYGTKINSRQKYRTNNTSFNSYSNGYSNLSDNKYLHFPEPEQTNENKPAFSESGGSYQNTNNFVHNYEPQENEDSGKRPSLLNFPKVVDFTKLNYPTELDSSKFLSEFNQPQNEPNSMKNTQIENTFAHNFNSNTNKNTNNNQFMDSTPKLVDHYNMKNTEEPNDKHKNNAASNKPLEQKKKIKNKPWSSGNYSNDFASWKDSSLKSYGYSTNYSNMNFKYDVSEPKKPFNPDELVPASSNVDLTNYQYPDSEYSNFKKMPEFNEDDEYNSVSFKEKSKPNDYLNRFKNSISTIPTTTSYWGNVYPSFKDFAKKPHYSEIGTDVVNIPKRPPKINYPKQSESKLPDWPYTHINRPRKINKPTNDWTKDLFDTRFKSEEDLLGLRTHDTSHPTYLPTFKPSNNVYDNDNEFKNLVERWRQSYLKTKLKDAPVRDYESYGSETKPMHVPIPKPYPVAVPVEKPYPVHVPYVRPVFHHTKPVHEDPENIEEEDFMRRPEIKKPTQYKKRPYGTRYRSRRPSRASYQQDRNRRRWPERRRPTHSMEHRHQSRPTEFHSPPYKHRDYEPEEDDEPSDYRAYCRRTGNC
ncbi:hypothetical protein HW555_011055, partial [Spodoptera exigua]